MKKIKILIIFLFLIINYGFAHKPKIFNKNFGNIHVTISVNEINEKINTGLIIGEYTKLMADKKKSNLYVKLTFFEDYTQSKLINSFIKSKTKDTLNLVFIEKFFDINDCLKIIEFAIDNPSRIKEISNKKSKIINSSNSKCFNSVIAEKIFRPVIINELSTNDDYNYYYENGYYKYFEKINQQVIFNSKTSISNFTVLNKNQFIIIQNTNLVFYDLLKNKEAIVELKDDYPIYNFSIINLNNNLIYFKNKLPFFENYDMIYVIDKKKLIFDISNSF